MTPTTSTVINNWATTRYELLNTRICDLGLKIEKSPLELHIKRFYRELDRHGLRFRPDMYLTDGWGCPDQVPVIGIPFYLADKRLARIEQEQTGEIETDATMMMFLRHEAGHAFNYAYRLWETPEWASVFGSFARPYRDAFEPTPLSRDFVRHLVHSQYGRHYAQKHPDEDFAETFAVWLTPRSEWRRKYRAWPVLKKLLFVDKLMRTIRRKDPVAKGGERVNPVENMTIMLADLYGQRTERYRAAAQGFVDDKLKRVFPSQGGKRGARAMDLIRSNRMTLVAQITQWTGLDPDDARIIVDKLESRASSLRLRYLSEEENDRRMDLTAMTISLAMDFEYTGRFTG